MEDIPGENSSRDIIQGKTRPAGGDRSCKPFATRQSICECNIMTHSSPPQSRNANPADDQGKIRFLITFPQCLVELHAACCSNDCCKKGRYRANSSGACARSLLRDLTNPRQQRNGNTILSCLRTCDKHTIGRK